MSQHILYFSKKCRFCQGFLEELARSPFSKEVRLVCVDPSPSRPPLPAWLKVVPTMILANGEEPLIGPMPVNNWLFSRKLLQGGGGNSSSDGVTPKPAGNAFKDRTEPLKIPDYSPEIAPRPGPVPKHGSGSTSAGPSASTGGDEPLPWHDAEMAGGNWSDSYSFVEDQNQMSVEKGMNRIVRNFELLGGPLPAGGSGNAGGSKPPQQRSAKEDKLLKEFEAFSKMRDMEFTGPKRLG
jgi:hypothetical protein